MRLQGKIAVVTGANSGSGIGLATAKRFAEEGARVFMTGRRAEQLGAAVSEVGGSARGVQGDIANLGDLDRLYEIVKAEAGHLDIVFANAGGGEFAPLGAITEEHYDRTFDINVKGTLHSSESVAAFERRRICHPDRFDCGVDGHSGIWCLWRDEGCHSQLRPQLDS